MEFIAKTSKIKHLGELLQEEQEPFVIEVYLSKRRYANRSKCSRGSSSSGRSTSRRSGVRLSKLLRILYSKVTSFNEKHRVKNMEKGGGTGATDPGTKREAAEVDRFSSSRDVTTYFVCSESVKEENLTSSEKEHASFDSHHIFHCEEKGLENSTIQWSIEKDKEQFDHVSVTKQANYLAPLHDWQQDLQHPLARHAPTCKVVLPKKITEDSTFSASILEILFHCSKDKQGFTRTEEATQASGSSASYRYLNSKMILEQTKQLLFDCVEEIIETHERKMRAKRHNQVTLGPEEIGKLIRDQIVAWGRTSIEAASTTELLCSDYLNTAEEWEDCVPQKMQISSEVGDAVIEEITNEIVLDMIDIQLQRM